MTGHAAFPGRVAGVVLLLLAALVTAACRKPATDAPDVHLALRVEPEPPVVGVATVEVRATDAAGAPVTGGTLRLEGNMSHAGMKPSFADAEEVAPGVYRAELDLTMRGDWFIMVEAVFPDGGRAERTFDLPGVRKP